MRQTEPLLIPLPTDVGDTLERHQTGVEVGNHRPADRPGELFRRQRVSVERVSILIESLDEWRRDQGCEELMGICMTENIGIHVERHATGRVVHHVNDFAREQ